MLSRIFQIGKGNHALTIQVNGKTVPLPLAPIAWAKPQRQEAHWWLEWRTQLTPLIGRETEMAALKAWLNQADALSFKIMHADGGAGKTRLAAELASAVHGKDWQAGMVPLKDFTVNDSLTWTGQTLLVLDYPEHSPEAVDTLIRTCASRCGLQAKSSKLRVLLLCREPATVLTRLKNGDANAFSSEPLPLGKLVALAQYDLFQAAMKNRGQAITSDLSAAFTEWQSRNALHHEPLFILALALHLASEPHTSPQAWLAAPDLLQQLLERETKRWEGIELAHGIEKGTLENSAAYCTLFDGLSISTLRQVFQLNNAAIQAMQAQLPHAAEIYHAMQPDLLGARFLALWRQRRVALGLGELDVEHFLKLCSDQANLPNLPNLLNRWDMQAYDQHVRLQLNQQNGVEQLLLSSCAKEGAFKSVMNAAVVQRSAWNGLTQLAVNSFQFDTTRPLPQQASDLHNYSIDLANAGYHPAALRTAQRAVEIREKLALASPAAYEPGLATSLNNLASFYSEAGNYPSALCTAQRAVEIYEKLALASPAAYEPNLAMSLNNLANRYSEADDHPAALRTAQRAVKIREKLALASPAAYEPNLATSLNNLANHYSIAGDQPAALRTAQRAVEIREKLALASPAAYEPDLTKSLNNLANCYRDSGDHPAALRTAQRAVEIYEKLALASPAAYEPDLAMSLNNLANCYSEAGDYLAALLTAQRAVSLYAKYHALHPAAFERHYAIAKGGLERLKAVKVE